MHPDLVNVAVEVTRTMPRSVGMGAMGGSAGDLVLRAKNRLKQHIGTPPIQRRKNSLRRGET
jgi:hypothetical protein